MVQQQLIAPGRANRVVFTPVRVEKERPYRVGAPSTTARTKLTQGRFHDRQWITAATPANVQMHSEARFLGKEADECRVPDFAFAFAAHENASALREVAPASGH